MACENTFEAINFRTQSGFSRFHITTMPYIIMM